MASRAAGSAKGAAGGDREEPHEMILTPVSRMIVAPHPNTEKRRGDVFVVDTSKGLVLLIGCERAYHMRAHMAYVKGKRTMQVAKVKIDTFVEPQLADAIQAYRKRQVGEVPSRAAAIRELLVLALRVDAGELAHES
jgi:hypothetical protein